MAFLLGLLLGTLFGCIGTVVVALAVNAGMEEE